MGTNSKKNEPPSMKTPAQSVWLKFGSAPDTAHSRISLFFEPVPSAYDESGTAGPGVFGVMDGCRGGSGVVGFPQTKKLINSAVVSFKIPAVGGKWGEPCGKWMAETNI